MNIEKSKEKSPEAKRIDEIMGGEFNRMVDRLSVELEEKNKKEEAERKERVIKLKAKWEKAEFEEKTKFAHVIMDKVKKSLTAADININDKVKLRKELNENCYFSIIEESKKYVEASEKEHFPIYERERIKSNWEWAEDFVWKNEVLPYLRRADIDEYRQWLKGFFEKGGKPTDIYNYNFPDNFWKAKENFKMPFFGDIALQIIIPKEILCEHEDLRESTLYLEDGYRVEGKDFVPIYKNIKY